MLYFPTKSVRAKMCEILAARAIARPVPSDQPKRSLVDKCEAPIGMRWANDMLVCVHAPPRRGAHVLRVCMYVCARGVCAGGVCGKEMVREWWCVGTGGREGVRSDGGRGVVDTRTLGHTMLFTRSEIRMHVQELMLCNTG